MSGITNHFEIADNGEVVLPMLTDEERSRIKNSLGEIAAVDALGMSVVSVSDLTHNGQIDAA